jgi:hypothetical protein
LACWCFYFLELHVLFNIIWWYNLKVFFLFNFFLDNTCLCICGILDTEHWTIKRAQWPMEYMSEKKGWPLQYQRREILTKNSIRYYRRVPKWV